MHVTHPERVSQMLLGMVANVLALRRGDKCECFQSGTLNRIAKMYDLCYLFFIFRTRSEKMYCIVADLLSVHNAPFDPIFASLYA